MLIYNNLIKINTYNNQIEIGEHIIDSSNPNKAFKQIKKILKNHDLSRLVLEDYSKLGYNEQLLLLAIATIKKGLWSLKTNEYLDITFSYNFPIYLEAWIIPVLLDNFNNVSKENMITLAKFSELIIVDVSKYNQYVAFRKKYAYCVRRGDAYFKMVEGKLDKALTYWNDYCEKTHNKSFSTEALEVYHTVYSAPGFNVINIKDLDEHDVVYGVYFLDNINKILFFCIMGWDNKFAKFSPGTYLYSKMIEFCYNNNYRFSFCYGNQLYKQQILEPFKEEEI